MSDGAALNTLEACFAKYKLTDAELDELLCNALAFFVADRSSSRLPMERWD